MKKLILLLSVLVTLFLVAGCATQVEPQPIVNDSNDSMIIEDVVNETLELDEVPSNPEFLHMDKCSKEDVFGVYLQYKGCALDDDMNLEISIANLGYLDMNDIWLFVVDGPDDKVVLRKRFSSVSDSDEPVFLQPKEDRVLKFSLIDLEKLYGNKITRLYVVPEVVLANNESATCLNYRIGFKPYDCKANLR